MPPRSVPSPRGRAPRQVNIRFPLHAGLQRLSIDLFMLAYAQTPPELPADYDEHSSVGWRHKRALLLAGLQLLLGDGL